MQTENIITRRRAIYGMTALATTGALTLPNPAHADVQQFLSGLTTNPSSSPLADDGNDLFFSFSTGLSSNSLLVDYDFSFKTFLSSVAAILPGKSGNYWLADTLLGGYALRLGSGVTIGSSGTFGNGATLASLTASYGNWNSFGGGFVGLQFQMVDGTHYGWAEIKVLPNYAVRLIRFGYETNPDTAIVTPQFTGPEPNALELLLIGFPAIGLYRLRQKQSKKAS
jgi:hypothetical protein